MYEDPPQAVCGDTCAEGTCLPYERCELVPVLCFAPPCNYPPVAYCIYDSDAADSMSYQYSSSYEYLDTTSWFSS